MPIMVNNSEIRKQAQFFISAFSSIFFLFYHLKISHLTVEESVGAMDHVSWHVGLIALVLEMRFMCLLVNFYGSLVAFPFIFSWGFI